MDYTLLPQLPNPSEIKKVLKEVEVNFHLDDGREVSTLLVYLPIQEGVSNHIKFLEQVKQGILHNFVFSYSEIEKKLGIKGDGKAAERLLDKAIRKLSQHTAHGELGELLLFTLLDVYFKAPKILSKISQKSSRKMPVYGADAVHGQFIGGKFKLYLGESKLYTDFKGASTKATKSIKTAKDKYEEEFDLLDSHMDFENMTKELETTLIKILDPFSENDLTELICSPCFIGFAEPQAIANTEEEFIKQYKELASDYINDFFSKAESNGIEIEETSLLMLPYTCAESFVKDFIDHLGIKK